MLRRVAIAAIAGLLGSCRCGDDGAQSETGPEPAVVDADVDARARAAIESLGDAGAMVVVLRPELWPTVWSALEPMLASIDLPAPFAEDDAAEPGSLPTLLLSPLGLSASATHPAGWDPNRPIFASLFEADVNGPVGGLTPRLDLDALPMLRHQVLLPATDTSKLVGSIADTLVALGGTAWPELVVDRVGARAVLLQRTAVAVIPEGERVHVVAVQPVRDRSSPGTVQRRLAIEAKPFVDSTPTRMLLRPNGVAAVVLRPSKLRAVSVLRGADVLKAALDIVGTEQRASLRARGLQIVLSSELLMGELGADFDETGLVVEADGSQLRVRTASALTPRGKAILDAAAEDVGGPFAIKAREAWLELYLGANLRRLLDMATVPAGMRPTTQAASTIQEGGPLAWLYVALRFPFGLVALAEELYEASRPQIPLEPLPVAVQAVWTGLEGDELPAGAVALEWPSDADASLVTRVVSLAKTDPSYAALTSDTVDRAGHPVTMIGFGVDPRAVIHGSGATQPDALARLRVDFRPLSEAMPSLEQSLSGLGELRVELARQGDTLTSSWVLSPADTPAELGAPLTFTRVPPRRRAAIEPKAARCLADAGLAIAQALRALGSVTSETLGAITTNALSEAQPHLECAARFADTRDAAADLRRMHVMLATDLMVEKGAPRSAALVLTAECEAASDATICERKKALDALPSPTLPRLALPVACGMRWDLPEPGARISIDERGIGMLDELVTATSLASRMRDPGRSESEPPAPVELTVDRDTTMDAVRPVLETLRSAGLHEVLVSVRDGSERRALPVSVREHPTTTEGDWVVLELDGTTLTRRTSTGDRSQTPTASMPDPAELLARLPADATVFVHADDEATWSNIATVLAAGCPHPTLTLRPRP